MTVPARRCLCCYRPLSAPGPAEFHPACSRRLFGGPVAPELPYQQTDMLALGLAIVQSQWALTGVQPKVTLALGPGAAPADPARFTIVGLWGDYILKTPARDYPHLSEVEDVTLHLAALAGIATVPHTLVRLADGQLAYLTRRIDRAGGQKLPLEDMAQLTDRLTEDKYRGSYEQVAKAIRTYAAAPGLDVVRFAEVVLFSFLTGNADMHLKNFSLLTQPGLGPTLAPAYDLVATALLMDDDDDTALLLNNRKRGLSRHDFDQFLTTCQVPPAAQAKLYQRLARAVPRWLLFLEDSFLPPALQVQFAGLIRARAARLSLPSFIQAQSKPQIAPA